MTVLYSASDPCIWDQSWTGSVASLYGFSVLSLGGSHSLLLIRSSLIFIETETVVSSDYNPPNLSKTSFNCFCKLSRTACSITRMLCFGESPIYVHCKFQHSYKCRDTIFQRVPLRVIGRLGQLIYHVSDGDSGIIF